MRLNLFEVIDLQKRAIARVAPTHGIVGKTLVVALMSEIKTRKRIKDSIGVQSEALALNHMPKLRFVLQCHPFCVTSVIQLRKNFYYIR